MGLVAGVLGLVLLGVYVQVERQRRARYEEGLRLRAYAEGVRFMESPGEGVAVGPTQAMAGWTEGETPRYLALYSIQNQLLYLLDGTACFCYFNKTINFKFDGFFNITNRI